MAPTDAYPQHVVTAVIVAHDGAAWLPRLIEALGEQTKPVQRVVAVDTGSRDRSGSVLAAQLGPGAVFGMDRSTGYAAAVRRAVQHKAASTPLSAASRSRGDEVEWLWLLHDDCEPAADALEQLLRGATETARAAVLGPKLRDWTDRDVIIEAGLAVDTAGRRVTGVEPREIDQGQHDGDRDALAVCSAGMLVRRDVWERLRGFDPAMALFDEDVDFCWRVHQAGFRVRVVTDAVVYHARAATRGRRAISVGRRARLLDRRNGLLTLLGNLPLAPMLACLIGNLTLSLLRTVFNLVAKRPTAALDESAAILGIVGHPLRLASSRRVRSHGRRAAYSALRADLPPGRSVRRVAELAATILFRPTPDNLAGIHHASADPADDDSLLVDSGFLQRVLTRPGVLLLLGLIVVTAVAERRILTGGVLGGGALPPAWEGASGLWAQFLQAYHPIGIGSGSAGPPYLGALALLATVLLGKAWLAVDVLLLGCVPLGGLAAYLALRPVTRSVAVRVWAAVAYALLPIAFGAIAAGRLGSAVAFVLIPVIGGLAGRMFTQPPRLARRAAWATGLAVSVGAAFVPLLWPLAVAGAALAVLVLRHRAAMLANLAIVALTPPVLLLPWLVQLVGHPTSLLLEAGIGQPGLASRDLPANALLLLSPGGPGLPPYWASAALLLVALVALLASRRATLVACGWAAALLGYAAALAASRVTVPAASGQPVSAWPGVALAVAAAGLVLAAAAAADGWLSARGRAAGASRSAVRRLTTVVLALAGCAAPALAAGWWLVNGVSGPVGRAAGDVVPSLVSNVAGTGRQLRTLVLASSGGHVSFLLLRGANAQFGYANVSQVPAAQAALSKAVAALVAPGGNEAANESQQLAGFDIGFVLMRAPVDASLAGVLDAVPGLTQVSMTQAFDLWRLTSMPSRVSVVEPNGGVVAVSSGPVSVSGAAVPAAGGTLLLAEPAGGWSAAVDGHGLTSVRSPAGSWAQAFRLPSGGGTLTISRSALWHDLLMAADVVAFLIVAGLALPGIRTAAELEAAAEATAAADEADEDTGAGRAVAGPGRAPRRRLRGGTAGARSRARALGRSAGAGHHAGARGRPAAGGSQLPSAATSATEVFSAAGDSGDERQSGRPPIRSPLPGATRAGRPAGAADAPVAWPMGQPASRFRGRQRPGRRYPDQPPGGQPRSLDPHETEPARRGSPAAPSASGRYGPPEPPDGPAAGRDRYGGRRPAGRSAGQHHQDAGYGAPGAENGPPDYDHRDYPAAPEYADGRPGGRGGPPRAGRWDDRSEPSAWPQDHHEPGWPQDSARSAQSWPDQGNEPAPPPPGELHHEWPDRRNRPRRGWPAPESESDGERR